MTKNKALAFLTIILLLPILACKILTAEPIPSATVLPGMPSATVQLPSIATAQPPSIATTVISSATSTPQATPPDVIATWFYQDIYPKSTVYYAFIVENPNPNLALENAQFQVVAYDSSGAILGTDTQDVGVLFPGEHHAISSYLSVPDTLTVNRISVQIIQSAEARISDQHGSPFTTEKVTFFQYQADPRITGVIRNNLNADISSLKITAIAYDESGNIIGSGTGWTYERLPANKYEPVIIKIHIVGEPAKVELYPILYSFDDIEEPSQTTEALRIEAVGASQTQYNSADLGMIVENTDSEARHQSKCNVIAYDENGAVLDIATIYIPIIFPGERLGVSGSLYFPEHTKLDKVEAQIWSGDVDEYDFWGFQKAGLTSNLLTADVLSYPSERNGGLITGIVKNSHSKDIPSIEIIAIAYDASGAIIGGWQTSVSSIPANGQVAISISTYLTSPPAVIELYPALTSFSAQQ